MDGNQFVHHCCCYCYLSFDFVIFVIISWTLLHSPLPQKKRFYQSMKQEEPWMWFCHILPSSPSPTSHPIPFFHTKVSNCCNHLHEWNIKKKTKVLTKIVKRSGFSEKKKLGFCLWYMHAQRRGLRDVIFFASLPHPLPLTLPPLPNPSSMYLQWWTHNKH
jgi:hypothetical protein